MASVLHGECGPPPPPRRRSALPFRGLDVAAVARLRGVHVLANVATTVVLLRKPGLACPSLALPFRGLDVAAVARLRVVHVLVNVATTVKLLRKTWLGLPILG